MLEVHVHFRTSGLVWYNGVSHPIENRQVYCFPPTSIHTKQWPESGPEEVWVWQVSNALVARAAGVGEEEARDLVMGLPFRHSADAYEVTRLLASYNHHYPRPDKAPPPAIGDPLARLHDMRITSSLLELLLSDTRYGDDGEGKISRIGKMMPVIERLATEGEGVAATARALGFSPEHLNRLFKQTTGRSVGECMAMMRVARARQLLVESDMPVGRAALESGFSTPGQLARVFKKYEGIAPKRWQMMARAAAWTHDTQGSGRSRKSAARH
jgi:AraC-like DNA-binding protein